MQGLFLTRGQLKHRMGRLLAPYWESASGVRKYWNFSDEHYYAPTRDELTRCLTEVGSLPGRKTEVFDCDDYAFALKGMASLYARTQLQELEAGFCLGIAWGAFRWVQGPHACNWSYLADGRLVWIDAEREARPILELPEARRGLRLVLI